MSAVDNLRLTTETGRICQIVHLSTAEIVMSRQVAKTRASIQSAFAELVFTRRYGDIRMTDIARAANVGRSTLYLHYKDKDEILTDNMAPILGGLAHSVFGLSAVGRVEEVLDHLWSHRDRARAVLFGATGAKLETALAKQALDVLSRDAECTNATVSPAFVANQIAASVFSILRTWVRGEASSSASDLAQYLCLSSAALRTMLK